MVMGTAAVEDQPVVYDVKLSSVVPASITGEDKVHELTAMDLVMKLHYIKGVYFFTGEAVDGLSSHDLKAPMFQWLALYYPVSGRIRRSEDGRPLIKCNDSGVRIVEAKCRKSLDEWLSENSGDPSANDRLIYSQALGPDLGFSPLVFVQFTMFSCGGLSVGLSWAHVLGDAFSAANFINAWGQIISTGNLTPGANSLHIPKSTTTTDQIQAPKNHQQLPLSSTTNSLKRVEAVGDHWLMTATNAKLHSHSFHVTSKHLNHLKSKSSSAAGSQLQLPSFYIVSGIIWKALAKIRGGGSSGLKIVTVVSGGGNDLIQYFPSNGQAIRTVESELDSVAEADFLELAELMAEKSVDERGLIEEEVEGERELSDFVVYGGNLTFVNLEEAGIYELELKGHRPVFANYMLSGIGDEGAVLVLPGPGGEGENTIEPGRLVNAILPEDQLAQLKQELRKEFSVF